MDPSDRDPLRPQTIVPKKKKHQIKVWTENSNVKSLATTWQSHKILKCKKSSVRSLRGLFNKQWLKETDHTLDLYLNYYFLDSHAKQGQTFK